MQKLATLILLIFICINHLNLIDNISYLHKALKSKQGFCLKKTIGDKDSEKDEETEKELKEKVEEKYFTLREIYYAVLSLKCTAKKHCLSVQLICPPFIDKDVPPPNLFA